MKLIHIKHATHCMHACLHIRHACMQRTQVKLNVLFHIQLYIYIYDGFEIPLTYTSGNACLKLCETHGSGSFPAAGSCPEVFRKYSGKCRISSYLRLFLAFLLLDDSSAEALLSYVAMHCLYFMRHVLNSAATLNMQVNSFLN